MNHKAFSKRICVIFLLVALLAATVVELTAANFIPPPPPSPAITIRSDGSVDPPSLGLNRVGSGNTYLFSKNITGYSVIVEKNNIVIDGQNYTLQRGTSFNNASVGILLEERNGVTVQNLKITGFTYGIKQASKLYGDPPANVLNNTFSGNTLTDNAYGIYISDKSNNILMGNTVIDNTNGVVIHSPSYNNILKNNRLENNTLNLSFEISEATNGYNNVDMSNTVNDKPVYYWLDQQGQTVPADAGYIALVGCSHMTLSGFDLKGNGQGLLLVDCRDITVQDSKFYNNSQGIRLISVADSAVSRSTFSSNTNGVYMSACSNITLDFNSLECNIYDAMYISRSNGIRITENVFSQDGLEGRSSAQVIGSFGRGAITLYDSSNNSILKNTLADGGEGISLHGADSNVIQSNVIRNNGGTGIYNYGGSYNQIIGNTITGNGDWAIKMGAYYNTVSGNVIADNSAGIALDSSQNNIFTENTIANSTGWAMEFTTGPEPTTNNTIIRNNFIGNQKGEGLDVHIPSYWAHPGGTTAGASNTWDDDKEGNYWSDYKSRYADATEVPGAGIWNTAWAINENNVDHCPLLSEYPISIPPNQSSTPSASGSPSSTPATSPKAPTSILHVVSPTNAVYVGNSVSLIFSVDQPTAWMGYSLDEQANATINGNTTITGLQSGSHTLTIYVRDLEGNIIGSEKVTFTMETKADQTHEPFPMTTAVVEISATCVVFACVALVWKRKKPIIMD